MGYAMVTKKQRIFIVGGGAAGMMAAISARRQGAEVTILEQNPRIGKKILATGNGRCNFTNIYTDVSCYHGINPKFAYTALANFDSEAAIDFFEGLGIAHKVEENGKVFPMSDQASSVLDVLMYELRRLDVTIFCDTCVTKILPKNNTFEIRTAQGRVFRADKVILTAGGKAMPSSGSNGNGFTLAKELGHTMTDIFPGLVQLKLDGPYFKQLDGVKIVGTAELLHSNKSLAKERGDILFTNYGISGPPILQLSRKAAELLRVNKEAVLKITIIDRISKEELISLIETRFNNNPEKTIAFSLVGLINKRLIPVLLKEAGITNLNHPVSSLSNKEREKIMMQLTDWRFKIRGTKSWASAQITAGGIDTNEINQHTMESKIIHGLFFAGEMIDIDGQCGGFNLQWAWSSGFIAGQNAALTC